MLQKIETFLCFCGDPLFVGAPVRPNMPKSASEPVPKAVYHSADCDKHKLSTVRFHSVISCTTVRYVATSLL